jgi:predicted RNA binding protein YcfA (HicA-like mRNA interferase family)
VLRDSRDIIRRLERDGFVLVSVRGSHHKFAQRELGRVVIVTIPNGTFRPEP